MGKLNSIGTLDDLELIALYKKDKDKNILGVLFKRYTRFVFSVCMKYLKDEDKSNDVVMDIFEQLFDKLLKHEISNFKPWLYSVAKNQCLHEMRENRHVLRDEWHEKNTDDSLMENNPFLILASNPTSATVVVSHCKVLSVRRCKRAPGCNAAKAYCVVDKTSW